MAETLLRTLIRDRHLTPFRAFEAAFGKAARDLAQREEDPALARVTISPRNLERWCSGQLASEPRPDACRVLEHMFGHPVRALLAPPLPGGQPAITVTASRPADHPVTSPPPPQACTRHDGTLAGAAASNTLDEDDMERRELLRLLGGMAAVAPLAAAIDQPRRNLDRALNVPTTAADVAEWERVVNDYELELGRVPPAVVLPHLINDLDEAQARLAGAPDALRAPMARVCGLLGEFTATQFLTVGDVRSARRYWRTALRVISQGDDRSAQALMLGNRATFGLCGLGSSPAASLAYADEAISVAGGTACAGTAQGYAARAHALALLGDHQGSVAAVQDLSDLFNRLAETTVGSVSSQVWSEQKLFFFQSRVYGYAGRDADAARANEAGRAAIPVGTPLPLADFGMNAAAAIVRSGDPSEGARHVIRTIQALPAGFRQSAVIRQQAARVLDLVPGAAISTSAVTEAHELLALPTGSPM